MKKAFFLLAAGACLLTASAAVEFDRLFGDHAVLQREAEVPVWGRGAVPGHEVRVRCGDASFTAWAQADGTFRAILPAQKAGGPYELTASADGETAVSRDVWIGEVWLASGQSNMEFKMKDADPAFPAGDHPMIRMFTVPHDAGFGRVQTLTGGVWRTAVPANLPTFSAVAGFFALELQKRLGCAVGILHSSWGGTRIESWTSREALLTDDVARPLVRAYERSLLDPDLARKVEEQKRHNFQPEARAPLDAGVAAAAAKWADAPTDGAWRETPVPTSFSTAYGRNFNGAVWFRRTVKLPADFVGQDLVLHVGAVDKHDRTYFNGTQVGATGKGRETDYWDKLRVYSVPAELVKDTAATVAVRVWSGIFAGGMNGPENELYLARASDPARRVALDGRWFTRIERELPFFSLQSISLTPGSPNAPYTLFDGMIAPLVGYGIRGAIWYQGCSNANRERFDFHYGELMKLLVRDWRYRWGQGDFPFIQVELANFQPAASCQPENGWPIVRQGQREAARALPNAGLASAIDAGVAHDIHPKNKQIVGKRLARWAFANVYGLETVGCGPQFLSASVEGDSVRVRFSDCGTGLVAKDSPEGIVRPCAVAGENGVFEPAEGRLVDGTLVIRSEKVKRPVRACYGWATNPLGLNLYNREGLPASPFMTK